MSLRKTTLLALSTLTLLSCGTAPVSLPFPQPPAQLMQAPLPLTPLAGDPVKLSDIARQHIEDAERFYAVSGILTALQNWIRAQQQLAGSE